MVNPQQATGRAESSTSDPGTHSTAGLPDQPTLYEFLTRLVSDPAARSAFDADPQATLDQAGLGGMTATDVLQATSLVLDYAPVEVVTAYDRSLQSSVEKFAASTQHVAINELHPAHPFEQEEQSMLQSTPAQPADFGKDSDVDATMPAPAPASSHNVDIDIENNDSHNLISVHDVLSNNNIGNDNIVASVVGNTVGQVGDSLDLSSATNVVGDLTYGTVSQVNETATHVFDTSVDLAAGAGTMVHGDVTNIVDNSVNLDVLNVVNDAPIVGDVAANVTNLVGNVAGGDLIGGVVGGDLVGGVVGGDLVGNVTGVVGNVPIAGDVVSNVAGGDLIGNVTGVVGDVAGGVPVVGDVVGGVTGGDVNVLPVDDVTSALPVDDVVSALPVDDVTSTLPVDDVVSALPVDDVTSALPVGDVVSHLPAPSDLPVAGPIVGEPVEDVVNTATSALPLDGLL
ncbi:IniB N-terminal domain-containing protein [Saccharopolyspora sp. K220]|uniref:IniB N-terminal domain-containing protein n=1 Tax=Saccharopolyspora soli TaxID=2926618 RepID=UPI001F56B9B3|nr:IniB N-terminal domain-containing protein [Saccharopolyspora soli]MCI2422014.1 IniB N-terminal domain-containing protein [Saccharopolyspora soli]